MASVAFNMSSLGLDRYSSSSGSNFSKAARSWLANSLRCLRFFALSFAATSASFQWWALMKAWRRMPGSSPSTRYCKVSRPLCEAAARVMSLSVPRRPEIPSGCVSQ